MFSDSEFRCPVCRAKQTLRAECRRCSADLRLVVRAHQRIEYLVGERQLARGSGEKSRANEIQAELNLLAPKR